MAPRPPSRARITARERASPDERDPRSRTPPGADGRPAPTPALRARERFLAVDPYRARREWARYEGTAQRDLFRQLRERFLERHRARGGWALEIGPGPGRFSEWIGAEEARRVRLDLSGEMLRYRPRRGGALPRDHRVRGDGYRPPFRPEAFAEVAAIGNVIGWAPEHRAVREIAQLTAPGGELVLELAPGPGERSRYLARLPEGAVARLLRSPVAAIARRVEQEGFEPLRDRVAKEHGYWRPTPAEIERELGGAGWGVSECRAVGPALGAELERLARVRGDPKAWAHLLELEELLGGSADRWEGAAAVLLAVRRSSA